MATENKIKYFENREDWRKWLTDNFETAKMKFGLSFLRNHQAKKALYTMMPLKKPFVSNGLTVQ